MTGRRESTASGVSDFVWFSPWERGTLARSIQVVYPLSTSATSFIKQSFA